MDVLCVDFRFSLDNYLIDDEPYPECLKEGKDGNIYIADKQTYFIRVFSASGNYINSFGGKGEGPGKFMRWFGVFDIDANGEICQVDFINGNRRITLFSPEGKLIESFSIKDPKKTGAMAIFSRNNGDFIVCLTGSVIIEKHGSLFYMGITNSFSIIDRKGKLKETLHEDKIFVSFSDKANGGWPNIPHQNIILSSYSPSRDTLALQKLAEDQVTLIDLKNKKTIRISNGFKLSPLTKQDIDDWIEEERSANPMYKALLPYYKKFRENGIGFNPNKPIVDRLFFNPGGELFISYYDKKKKKYTINKFSNDNKRLEMKILDRIPTYIGKDRIYYMIYDEEDDLYTVEVKTNDEFFKGEEPPKKEFQ
jgi:hypothetical protein